MDVLQSFIEEHSSPAETAGSGDALQKEREEGGAGKEEEHGGAGELFLLGSCDWDKMTSKAVAGLDSAQRILLPNESRAISTFSSPNSCHLFILCNDQKILAMGKNGAGQLGVGSRETCYEPIPVRVTWPSELRLVKIATGKAHSLFLFDNGQVYGCGSASCGQLGLGGGKKAMKDVLEPILLFSLSDIRDIACGAEFSVVCDRSKGHVYCFGHPEYGQLGNGKTGEYIQESKKGIQYNFVTSPTLVERFLRKDNRGNTIHSAASSEIKICAVAAGRNHCMCLEEWNTETGTSRVFSWGFGGFGRLGHNCASDEFEPREITSFRSNSHIRHIFAGSTFSLAISSSNQCYFCGILPNSPRGEATTSPRVVQELYDFPVDEVTGGSSWVITKSSDKLIFWGTPIAGKFGLEGSKKSSSVPTFMACFDDMKVRNIACGYGHCCVIASCQHNNEDKLLSFPDLQFNNGEERVEMVIKGKGNKKRKMKDE